VTFKVDGVNQAPVAVNGAGQAALTTAALAVGAHTVVATYSGDANFGASASATFNQTVNKAGTTIGLISSLNPANAGQAVTFTATVSAVAPGAGAPTGTVTFKDGATTLGTITLDSNAQSKYTTSALAAGSHSITATYNGDSNFNTSATSALPQTINAVVGATLTPTPITPTASATPATTTPMPTPVPTPVGGVGIGASGGSFTCAGWIVTLPANVVPNGSTLHCVATTAVPATTSDKRLLAHAVNALIYDSSGKSLTAFNPQLKFCYPYTSSDLAAAGGSTSNFVVLTAPVNGAWSELTTTIDSTLSQACANTDHLTLFELAARVPTTVPNTGANEAARADDWLLLGALLIGLGWLARRRLARRNA
jgi:hypothetical protein